MTIFEVMDEMGYTMDGQFHQVFYKFDGKFKKIIIVNTKEGTVRPLLTNNDLIKKKSDISSLYTKWLELEKDISALTEMGAKRFESE